MRDVTTATFSDEVFDNPGLVLVDFWATWCGPCKPLAALLETLEPEFADKITFVKVECVANPDTAAEHNVKSLPTLMLFKAGFPVDTQIGSGRTAAQIRDWLTKHLG